MYHIIRIGLWFNLRDEQIDWLIDKYLKIRYGISLKESIEVLSNYFDKNPLE